MSTPGRGYYFVERGHRDKAVKNFNEERREVDGFCWTNRGNMKKRDEVPRRNWVNGGRRDYFGKEQGKTKKGSGNLFA